MVFCIMLIFFNLNGNNLLVHCDLFFILLYKYDIKPLGFIYFKSISRVPI